MGNVEVPGRCGSSLLPTPDTARSLIAPEAGTCLHWASEGRGIFRRFLPALGMPEPPSCLSPPRHCPLATCLSACIRAGTVCPLPEPCAPHQSRLPLPEPCAPCQSRVPSARAVYRPPEPFARARAVCPPPKPCAPRQSCVPPAKAMCLLLRACPPTRLDFEGLEGGEDGALEKLRAWSRSIEDLQHPSALPAPFASSLARSARQTALRYVPRGCPTVRGCPAMGVRPASGLCLAMALLLAACCAACRGVCQHAMVCAGVPRCVPACHGVCRRAVVCAVPSTVLPWLVQSCPVPLSALSCATHITCMSQMQCLELGLCLALGVAVLWHAPRVLRPVLPRVPCPPCQPVPPRRCRHCLAIAVLPVLCPPRLRSPLLWLWPRAPG